MSAGDPKTVSGSIAARQAKTKSANRREEIVEIVESVVDTLRGDEFIADPSLYQELEELAIFIQRAKSEIADIRPEEISDEHIPSATDELDAIVSATETATGTILDAAEIIEELSRKLEPDVAKRVGDAVTQIYEACNFQDVTGQRITKVVSALKQIEEKVDALIDTFGGDIRKTQKKDTEIEENSPTEPVDKGEIIGGPQLPGDGISQDDIDALLASAK